jgi:hypothetical protein
MRDCQLSASSSVIRRFRGKRRFGPAGDDPAQHDGLNLSLTCIAAAALRGVALRGDKLSRGLTLEGLSVSYFHLLICRPELLLTKAFAGG